MSEQSWAIPLVELRQTCFGCPSQWEGRFSDGTLMRARYRWGTLTAAGFKDGEGVIFHSMAIGDPLNGCMTTDEMLKETGLVLAPGVVVTDDCT